MSVPLILGFSNASTGAILGGTWCVILGVGLFRYRTGTYARRWLYRLLSLSLIWISYSLFQITSAFEGITDAVIVLLGVGLLLLGLVMGVRWWQSRSDGESQKTAG
ncbi:hypothetical protein [Haladaptatus litoreus]|nr:hypothetical protein [Haladaptatus litoreus]